ncbi:MAG: serine kinase [Ktedonobacteraceae bacterium]
MSESYFQYAENIFFEAVENNGGIKDTFYSVAGLTVRLCFASNELMDHIIPAFEHISTRPVPRADLTICLWDCASTNTECLKIPLGRSLHEARTEEGEVRLEKIFSAYNPGSKTLSLLHSRNNVALFWTEDASKLPDFEKGAPLRTIFSWYFSSQSLQMVHAGAVGTSEGGILLGGKGGSGKSTCAISCIGSNLSYLSDDYCLIGVNGEAQAHSLYGTAKLDASGLQRFFHLSGCMANPDTWKDGGKALYFIHQLCPENLVTTFPVKGVVIPRITGCDEPYVSPLSRAQILVSIAPSTVFQHPGVGPEAFSFLSDFVKRIPGFQLCIGPDIARIPGVLKELLGELASGTYTPSKLPEPDPLNGPITGRL